MAALLDQALLNAGVATVLALIVGGIALVYRRPALLHCLWLLVLLKLLTPAVVPVSIPWPKSAQAPLAATLSPAADAAEPVSHETAAIVASEADAVEWIVEVDSALLTPREAPPVETVSAEPTFPLRDTLLAAWVAGSIIWLTWTAFHLLCFRRILRHAQPASKKVQQRVLQLAKTLGLTSPPPTSLVPGAVSPMIWAFGTGPRLIFPARLLDRLDDQQLDALILHELAHVLRRDHWVRVLELVVTALFWWHPVLWWAKREIHEAEEQCCDAWVIWALADGRRSYALALVHTVDFCSQARSALPAAASGIGPIPHLRRRLTMIMQGTTPRSLSWAGACAVLGLGLLLPLAPVYGQEKADEEVDADVVLVQDSRDHQIEVLKKALQVLEEQKQGDKGGKSDRPKADPADIEKARKELERRERDVKSKRDQLSEAEQRLQEARRNLAFAQGRPVPPEPKRVHLDLRHAKPGDGPQGGVAPGQYKIEARVIDGKPSDGKKGEERRVILVQPDGHGGDADRIIRIGPDGVGEGPARVRVQLDKVPGEQGKMDLEGRLEKLIREVEEIRREMRRQPRSDARPLAPATVVPPTPRPPRPGARADNAGQLLQLVPTLVPDGAPTPPVQPTLPTVPTPPPVNDDRSPSGPQPTVAPTSPKVPPPPPPPPSDDGDGEPMP